MKPIISKLTVMMLALFFSFSVFAGGDGGGLGPILKRSVDSPPRPNFRAGYSNYRGNDAGLITVASVKNNSGTLSSGISRGVTNTAVKYISHKLNGEISFQVHTENLESGEVNIVKHTEYVEAMDRQPLLQEAIDRSYSSGGSWQMMDAVAEKEADFTLIAL